MAASEPVATTTSEKSGISDIGLLNHLNAIWYVISAIVTFLVQFLTKFTPSQMSQRYQTIITPAGTAFAIWGFIFVVEGVFVVAQYLPQFRNCKLVRAVTPFWVMSCAFQSAWLPIFCQDNVEIGLFIISGLCASLVGLLVCTDFLEGVTILEEAVILSGFSIHAGWTICATALNVNSWIVLLKYSAYAQFAWASCSVAIIFALVCLLALGLPRRPNFFVPLVLAWASYWISDQLEEATYLRDSTREFYMEFDEQLIQGMRGATLYLAIASAGVSVLSMALRVVMTFRTRVLKVDEDDTSVELNKNVDG